MVRSPLRLALVFALAAAPTSLLAQAWLLDSAAPTVIDESPALLNAGFTPLPDGRVLAYGNFTHINGTAAAGLARLSTEGQVDPGFVADNPANSSRWVTVAPLGTGGFVAVVAPNTPTVTWAAVPASAIANQGPTSIFGTFEPPQVPLRVVPTTPAGPTGPASTLVRLRADGRRDPAFAPLACDGVPRLLPMADGRILVSGTFTTLGGLPRNSLARLEASGAIDPRFAPALASAPIAITAAALTADGAVIASGYSYDANRQTTYHFARVTAAGAIDASFAPPAISGTFSLLVPQPDGGVLAGNYTLFRYSPTGAIDFSYALKIPQLKSLVRAAPLSRGRMVVEASVGPANNYGNPAVFTISPTGEVETDHRTATGAQPAQRLLAVFPDERLLLLQAGTLVSVIVANETSAVPAESAGAVSSAVAVATATATAIDPAAAAAAAAAIVPIIVQPTLTNPSLALRGAGSEAIVPFSAALTQRRAGSVTRLDADALGRVIANGSFTHINSQPRPGLARFNADGSLDAAFAPVSAVELLLVPPDGRPVVRANGRVARLRDDGSLDPAFTFPANLDPTKTRWLAGASDGRLLISAFVPNDSAERNLKLIWLGADGTQLTTLPTAFGGFAQYYLAVTPIYVTTAPTSGTTPATSSVATTTVPTSTTGTTATTSATTVSIATTTINVVPTPDTRTNPITPIISSPYIFVVPNTLNAARILPDNRILVSGNFQTADGLSRPGLAWLHPDGSVDGPRPTTPVTFVANPTNVAISVIAPYYSNPPSLLLPDGRALVFTTTYPLSQNGYMPQVHVKRVRDDGTTDPTFQPPPNTLSTTTRALADGSLFSNGRRFSADAVLDANFAPEFRRSGSTTASPPWTVVLAGNHLWAAGGFDQVDGLPRAGLARFLSAEVVGITFGPRSQTVVAGRDTIFNVVLGTHQSATYRWTHDGAPLAGATNATLRLPDSSAAHAGDYRVIATIGGREFTSEPATLTIAPNTARLVNFSARSTITPASPQIAGIVCADVAPRTVLLRAIGRGLIGAAGTTLLPAPVLTLYTGDRALAENRGSAAHPAITALAREVGAFPVNTSSTGSALARELGAGAFTAITTSGDAGAGVSLFEFYDTGSAAGPALVRNFSIRGQTSTGGGVLTAGIVIAGNGPLRVLVRGIGPALASFGVTGAVADPVLHVFASSGGTPLATNDDWANAPDLAAAAASARAFPLAPASRDAALVLNLEPGAYTAQLVPATGAAGEGLIEIYALDR